MVPHIHRKRGKMHVFSSQMERWTERYFVGPTRGQVIFHHIYKLLTQKSFKTDVYKVYSSVWRSFSPSNRYLFFVQCYLTSFCCNLLPHSSKATIFTLSYVSEGGSGTEFLCKNWYLAKVGWTGFLETLLSLCSSGSLNSKVRETRQRGFEDAKEQQKKKKKQQTNLVFIFQVSWWQGSWSDGLPALIKFDNSTVLSSCRTEN